MQTAKSCGPWARVGPSGRGCVLKHRDRSFAAVFPQLLRRLPGLGGLAEARWLLEGWVIDGQVRQEKVWGEEESASLLHGGRGCNGLQEDKESQTKRSQCEGPMTGCRYMQERPGLRSLWAGPQGRKPWPFLHIPARDVPQNTHSPKRCLSGKFFMPKSMI